METTKKELQESMNRNIKQVHQMFKNIEILEAGGTVENLSLKNAYRSLDALRECVWNQYQALEKK